MLKLGEIVNCRRCDTDYIHPYGAIWIDMESKLRTKDKFDLEKCEKVLQAVEPWTG